MKYIFIIFSVVCLYSCKYEKRQQSKINVFEEHEQINRYSLDIAIEKSQKENKPIFLWVSFHGNATDAALMSFLNQIDSVREYMLDSIVYCRLIVGNKLKPRAIKNSTTKSLLPLNEVFKTEGEMNEWICDNFFDSQNHFMIVTDFLLRKLTAYHYNNNFDHDSVSFLTFLRKGHYEYEQLKMSYDRYEH